MKPWYCDDKELQNLGGRYVAWTDMMAARSMEAIYTLGAANGFVLTSDLFKSNHHGNCIAFSLIFSFLHIFVNLFGAFILKELILRRYLRAEKDRNWWEKQIHEDSNHPEGTTVFKISVWLHNLRFIIPMIAFVFFIVGVQPFVSKIIWNIEAKSSIIEQNNNKTIINVKEMER